MCIPMYLLAPLFSYGRLLPSMLMSGLRIEIKFAHQDQVSVGMTVETKHDVYMNSTNPSWEIENPMFTLSSVQLSDNVQRSLNELSATNGLEIVYTDYEHTSHNAGNAMTQIHLEVRKSCSRALKAFARVRRTDRTNPHYSDSFRAERVFPFLNYQWQLGSLYFPQQPVTGGVTRNKHACGISSYAHFLEACDKFHGSARPLITPLYGTSSRLVDDMNNSWGYRRIYVDDVKNELKAAWVDTTNGQEGSYMNDAHTIAVTLERSTMFNLAGVPVNNSRVLCLKGELTADSDDGENATAGLTRQLDIYLKYVKLARVWLNNVEVEQ
jgi:hypothetical protein